MKRVRVRASIFCSSLLIFGLTYVCLFATQTEANIAFLATTKPGYYLTASLQDDGLKLTVFANQPNQKWDSIYTSLSDYPFNTIVSGTSVNCSNQCLDVFPGPGGVQSVGQMDCNPARLGQYWLKWPAPAKPTPSNYLWLKNFRTGNCMTSETWTTPPYVDDYPCTDGADNQLWWVSDPPDANLGGSTITNKADGSCLRVSGGSPRGGATMTMSPCASPGAFYQHFNVTSAPMVVGYRNQGTLKCLDGGVAASPPAVPKQSVCDPTGAALQQQWIPRSFPEEGPVPYVYLVDFSSGLCLTAQTNQSNLPVTMAPCVKGNTYQQWQMF